MKLILETESDVPNRKGPGYAEQLDRGSDSQFLR